MQLKKRLKLIAGMIPSSCHTVCDIGTDHAYLPIYLLRNGICKRAVACDLTDGPVEMARKNVELSGLEQKIDVRLGNGLEPVSIDEAEIIVIAGMGGILIRDILQRSITKARKAGLLILQPMIDVELLREWLYNNGFDITDEAIATEGERLYNIIAARWTGNTAIPDQMYFQVSKKLVDKRDSLAEKQIRRKLKFVEKALKEIDCALISDIDTRSKRDALIELELKLKKILEGFINNISGG